MSFWKTAGWLSRLLLVVAVIFFLFLASQWLVDPTRVSNLAESGITLESAAAVKGNEATRVPIRDAIAPREG